VHATRHSRENLSEQSLCRPAPRLQPWQSADAEERGRFRQFCLISPHQGASVCDADDVYLGTVDQKAWTVFTAEWMVWYFFFQKKAPNSENFNEFYHTKLWFPQKTDAGESQTKLKKTRKRGCSEASLQPG